MATKSPITIETLKTVLSPRIPELHARYGLKTIGVFGSCATGVQRRGSDVDLLVEFDESVTVTLLGFVALEEELGKLVGRKVDLVEKSTLKPAIGRRILGEVVPL